MARNSMRCKRARGRVDLPFPNPSALPPPSPTIHDCLGFLSFFSERVADSFSRDVTVATEIVAESISVLGMPSVSRARVRSLFLVAFPSTWTRRRESADREIALQDLLYRRRGALRVNGEDVNDPDQVLSSRNTQLDCL